jgi:hypothetical protein
VHAYGLTQYPEWVDLIILSCQFCRVTTATNVVIEAMVGCEMGTKDGWPECSGVVTTADTDTAVTKKLPVAPPVLAPKPQFDPLEATHASLLALLKIPNENDYRTKHSTQTRYNTAE